MPVINSEFSSVDQWLSTFFILRNSGISETEINPECNYDKKYEAQNLNLLIDIYRLSIQTVHLGCVILLKFLQDKVLLRPPIRFRLLLDSIIVSNVAKLHCRISIDIVKKVLLAFAYYQLETSCIVGYFEIVCYNTCSFVTQTKSKVDHELYFTLKKRPKLSFEFLNQFKMKCLIS